LKATAAIEPGYFQTRIDGGASVYRERVYCYELYHQMRTLWPRDVPFVLNGEVDKVAHPLLAQLGADSAKPDFLVHLPGRMEGNFAIIEVKSANAVTAGMRKDLSMLKRFVERVGYRDALYLIFGNADTRGLLRSLERAADGLGDLPPIAIWHHAEAGEEARLLSVFAGGPTSAPPLIRI